MSRSQSPFLAGSSRLVPILHADDCGLSAGITDGIVACYDRGLLRRTSVVVNGAGWHHAVAALRRRPRLSVGLHLNFFEGSPISSPSELDMLVNRQGRFARGFAALWLRGIAGADAARLRGQLRLEMRRQIERFLQTFGDRGPLLVDGHVHYHILPPVFDELMHLSTEYPIGAIRLPREPLYWPFTPDAPRPAIRSVTKNVVLRLLCRRAGPAVRARALKTTERFVGVLGRRTMTLANVRAALEHLRRTGETGTVEILFHPGRARPDEAPLWSDRPELRDMYLSADRDREAELLCSPGLGQLLRAYCAVPQDRAALPSTEVAG